ncbi:asparagine synthase (glutamine-hydrolyzing), partial [Paucibacter sp. TC2R-5]|uniref:asparagine synthase (glutamine-hydrolyzing) n=1 Tax=Paucibacter sp. TC2R-5 TaxID=2893555 RepID=UPI0021E4206D
MCGLTGFFRSIQSDANETNELNVLRRMAGAIRHRGPDSEGFWNHSASGISLAHRRLAIVDLSQTGHQPMHSPSGRYVLVFNGEIYNHQDLRRSLDGMVERAGLPSSEWRGHSDTESLLAGFDVWGIQGTLERAIGMFAVAVWDRQLHTLTLARDRLGEKPLYYGWQGQGNDAVFLFGSELKALRAHPAFTAQVDRGALSLLLRHSCIPAPYSIYSGISKLRPGQLLTVSSQQPQPQVINYWSGAQAATQGVTKPFAGSPEQAVDALERLLSHAIGQQMMADVPLGAFLSGGVDSSAIVALMQSQSSRPVKTFTIGFGEAAYNEAEHAKAVAQHLGTEHTELYVTPQAAFDLVPRLPALYDEPFSDSSQLPTFLVSQLARQHVTVSLSGDAGDELFCGYNRYQMASGMWRKLSKVPTPLRKLFASGITAVPPHIWNRAALAMPGRLRATNIGDKLHKGAKVLSSPSLDALYLGLVSHWDDPAEMVIGGHEPPTLLTGNAPDLQGLDPIQRMMALDLMTYLPDDILTKVDRAAMGVSLETRVPFLDHRVVEFAWSLPQSMKLHDGQSKWALRQVLYRHVPKELIERPKMGFGVPLDVWLRGPLRPWAEELLDEARLRREGYFHPAPIRQKWGEHLSGKRNWAYHLWDV